MSSAQPRLYSCECIPRNGERANVKSADDTAIISQVTNNDKNDINSHAQKPIYCSMWTKPRRLIVDLRRKGGKDTHPVYISGAEMEQVNRFRFLGINVTENLSWFIKHLHPGKETSEITDFFRMLVIVFFWLDYFFISLYNFCFFFSTYVTLLYNHLLHNDNYVESQILKINSQTWNTHPHCFLLKLLNLGVLLVLNLWSDLWILHCVIHELKWRSDGRASPFSCHIAFHSAVILGN